MSAVERTRRAKVDVLQIWVYVAEKSESAAARLLKKLNADIPSLGRNPMMGEAIGHLAPRLRRFSSGACVSIFRPLPEGIRLLRVIHGSRDIADVLDGIDEARE